MMSIAALAARDQVKKSGVSRRVKQLRDNGLYVELDHQGRVALVHSVQYDALRHRFADPSKAQAPSVPPPMVSAAFDPAPPEGANESYDEARRVKTWAEAESARLKLDAERGLYVPVEKLEAAVDSIADAVVHVFARLPQAADDLAAAVAKDGASGARALLKKMGTDFGTEIADALVGLLKNERPS